MTYRNKYARGVIVIVKKEISEYFIENMLIPSKRGITLTTTNIYDDTNTHFYFIYGPPQFNKQKVFGKNLNKISNQQQTKKINIILLKT
jgi:hypothetical protein